MGICKHKSKTPPCKATVSTMFDSHPELISNLFGCDYVVQFHEYEWVYVGHTKKITPNAHINSNRTIPHHSIQLIKANTVTPFPKILDHLLVSCNLFEVWVFFIQNPCKAHLSSMLHWLEVYKPSIKRREESSSKTCKRMCWDSKKIEYDFQSKWVPWYHWCGLFW